MCVNFDQKEQFVGVKESSFSGLLVIYLLSDILLGALFWKNLTWFIVVGILFLELASIIYIYNQIRKIEKSILESDIAIFDEITSYREWSNQLPIYDAKYDKNQSNAVNQDEILLSEYDLVWLSEKNGTCCYHAFYTTDKADRIRTFVKLFPRGTYEVEYPLRIQYYPEGSILASVDLIDDYPYPEDFRKLFLEIKAMI